MERDPTPYPEINAVLHALLSEVQATLGDRMVGMYLCGSLASGDFDPTSSDIDFVVVTAGALPGELIGALEAVHARLIDSGLKWAIKLEGTYLPRDVIRHYQPGEALYPSLNEGSFYMGRHGGEWVIQSHILREHGVALAGPAPRDLIDPISPDDLRRATQQLLADWWAPMLQDTMRLRGDEYQAYAILTMCRALYTLATGAIASKAAAARWAREALGPRRATLIARALAWRPGMRLDALRATVELIGYTIECSRKQAQ